MNSAKNMQWRRKIASDVQSYGEKLMALGAITSVPEYRRIFGMESFDQWLESDECRIVAMMAALGKDVSECSRCDVCMGNNPRMAMLEEQRQKLARQSLLKLHMEELLSTLEKVCLVCNSSSCNGHACVPRGNCNQCCISGHIWKGCAFNGADELTSKNNSCAICYLPVKYGGAINNQLHGVDKSGQERCKHKRRFHRLVAYISRKDLSMDVPLGTRHRSFVRKMYASDELFLEHAIKAKVALFKVHGYQSLHPTVD
jgi:hypothetical protein